MSDKIDINKRQYNKSLSSTVVVICLDGSQKEYIDIASSKGLTPNLDKILENGQYPVSYTHLTLPTILLV